jgi:hypothetical protein
MNDRPFYRLYADWAYCYTLIRILPLAPRGYSWNPSSNAFDSRLKTISLSADDTHDNA